MAKRGSKGKQKKLFIHHPIIGICVFFILLLYLLKITDRTLVTAKKNERISTPIFCLSKKINPSAAILLPEIIEHGPRNKQQIALTFDADMTYGMLEMFKNKTVESLYDKKIIDYLKQEKVKATVFMSGLWVEAYPKEARDIAGDKLFEIGNHTYSHLSYSENCYGLVLVKKEDEIEEVKKAQKVILEKTGVIPRYFRFPGGCSTKETVEEISNYGMKIVHWDVVGGDAFNYNPETIVKNVRNNVKNGSIIVLHLNGGSTAPKTYDGLVGFIPELKSMGFEFVKLSELID